MVAGDGVGVLDAVVLGEAVPDNSEAEVLGVAPSDDAGVVLELFEDEPPRLSVL